MTRLVTCGWETGDPWENQTNAPDLNGYWSCVTTNPTPRPPSVYCLKANTYTVTKTWTFPANKTEVYVRVRMYFPSGTNLSDIFYWQDSTGSLQSWLTWNSTTKLLNVQGGLATSSLLCADGAWHLIEAHWKCTSTSAATDGTIRVWQDGTLVINAVGTIDSTNSSTMNVRTFQLRASGSNPPSFDDLAINDTLGTINNGQIGEGSIVLLKPNGPGSSAAQTIGGTSTGANWSQQNELPPSMAQYVYSATPGAADSYALDNLPSTGSWSVNCVEEIVMAQTSDTGTGSLGLTVKSGVTSNESPAIPLAVTPTYYRQQYETDPNTGAPWTNAAVNALEAGTTVR